MQPHNVPQTPRGATIRGRADFRDADKQIRAIMNPRLRAAVDDSADILLRTMQKQVVGARSGREYTIKQAGGSVEGLDGVRRRYRGKAGKHRASAEGESPAKRSGRGRASISRTKTGWASYGYRAEVGTKEKYMVALDRGFRFRPKLKSEEANARRRNRKTGRFLPSIVHVKARPWVMPAIRKATPEIHARMRHL